MSYITYPHFYSDDADTGLSQRAPVAVSVVGQVLSVIGGGILFAATLYLIIVLL